MTIFNVNINLVYFWSQENGYFNFFYQNVVWNCLAKYLILGNIFTFCCFRRGWSPQSICDWLGSSALFACATGAVDFCPFRTARFSPLAMEWIRWNKTGTSLISGSSWSSRVLHLPGGPAWASPRERSRRDKWTGGTETIEGKFAEPFLKARKGCQGFQARHPDISEMERNISKFP